MKSYSLRLLRKNKNFFSFPLFMYRIWTDGQILFRQTSAQQQLSQRGLLAGHTALPWITSRWQKSEDFSGGRSSRRACSILAGSLSLSTRPIRFESRMQWVSTTTEGLNYQSLWHHPAYRWHHEHLRWQWRCLLGRILPIYGEYQQWRIALP